MRLRRLLAVLAVFPAVAAVQSCVAIPIINADFAGAGSGNGGATFETGSTSGAGEGGGLSSGGETATGTGTGGGGGILAANPFEYLCGGSAGTCLPGAMDTCAPGGNPGMGGQPADAGVLSCQVVASVPGGDAGYVGDGGVLGAVGVTSQCGLSGTGVDSAVCSTAADCAPELGCVKELTAVCRAYCCLGNESCPTDTYCVTETMNEAPQAPIPVCVAAMKCVLLDDTTCPAGQTCAIVRESGTTSCVPVGSGTDGQACPCAAGYNCSLNDGTCQKVCASSADCGAGEYCQGGTSPYPQGVGYCVKFSSGGSARVERERGDVK